MKLLIAEDEVLLQFAMKRFMNLWDYEFDMVLNGQEAVEQARKNEGKYDLCLMDINMPIMDGFEATKIIRHKVKYFPIMALTANINIKDKYLEVGMDDFLEKPYDMDELYDKISELTVKAIKIHKEQNQISLVKEIPMNQDELKELRELDKKGLTKFSLIDTGYKFIVHKNLQNKISHDFIAKEKKMSEFLDRSADDPGIIHLYASNLHANKRHILPEILEQLVQEEDEDLKSYTTKAEYPEKENPESNATSQLA